MPEIDPLNSSFLYSGIQAASTKTQKEKESEKAAAAKKLKFSEVLKSSAAKENQNITTELYPPEISSMSLEQAVIFLRDEVETAGNALSAELSMENLQNFKTKIKAFLTYVEKNNFEVKTTVLMDRRHRKPIISSPLPVFSTYQSPPVKRTKTSFTVINEKLDELTKDMLLMQKDNIQLLAQIEDIKGLIINLLD